MSSPQDLISPVTISNYALGALDGATLNNPMLAVMRKQGDWDYDVAGLNLVEAVEAGFDRPIISAPGMDLSAYAKPIVRYTQANLPWGEIAGVKTVDQGILRRNNGPQALVKIRDKEIPSMLRGMLDKQDGLLHQFLNQDISTPTQFSGPVTGLPLAGLPSFLKAPTFAGLLGYNGLLGPGAVYTGIAVAATDKEAVCPTSATYAGLTLAPNGLTTVDNVIADAWTPTLVNASSTAWNGAANVSANILQSLQWLADRCQRFTNSDSHLKPDSEFGAWLSYDYYHFLAQQLAAKQGIYLLPTEGSAAPQTPTGTNNVWLPHAGYKWRWDERMPSSSGFLITWAQIMVRVQKLFANQDGNGNPLGKSGADAGIIEAVSTYDPLRRQWIATGTFPGQVFTTPRYHGRIGAYA